MFIAVASLILVGCEPGAVSTEEGAQTASAKQAITTGAAVQSGRGNDPINPAAADQLLLGVDRQARTNPRTKIPRDINNWLVCPLPFHGRATAQAVGGDGSSRP